MNVLRLITDFIKMSKVWFLSMEFYGAWQLLGHFYKISDKSQNVHTADLGYLGFKDYHKKFSAL